MIEALAVLYVLIGFLFSVGMWNAYNLDNSPEKNMLYQSGCGQSLLQVLA